MTAADAVLRKLSGDGPLVCVDMGSTVRMGLLPAPARFAAVLDRALQAAGCRGVVLTGGYAPLEGAREPSVSPTPSYGSLQRGGRAGNPTSCKGASCSFT